MIFYGVAMVVWFGVCLRTPLRSLQQPGPKEIFLSLWDFTYSKVPPPLEEYAGAHMYIERHVPMGKTTTWHVWQVCYEERY